MLRVKVKVKFFSLLASKIGTKEKDLEVSEDFDLALEEIETLINYPLGKEIREAKITFLLNGHATKLYNKEITLENNDALAFLPIMGGG